MDRTEQFSYDLISGLQKTLGGRVLSIIIYGSVARGTATEESDVDVAVVVKGVLDDNEEELLSEFVVDMNLKYDRVFSVIDIENDEFEKWGDVSPFYRNVREEGIVLWKAA